MRSFSDGGSYASAADAATAALSMFADGAALVDIGGESTRPGAERPSVEEELRRVLPVVRAVAEVAQESSHHVRRRCLGARPQAQDEFARHVRGHQGPLHLVEPQIRQGLPEAGPFTAADCRCFAPSPSGRGLG